MPLTPFHLAAGLPLRKYVSIKPFVLVNILIDLEVGFVMFFGMDDLGYSLHRGMHTLGGATLAIVATMFIGIPYTRKILPTLYGAMLGAYSHIFLDALVHSDVEPFAPILYGNPMYLDIHAEVSLVCALLLTYYLARWVESLHVGEVGAHFIKRMRRKFFSGTLGE